jgi:hypothetical protein
MTLPDERYRAVKMAEQLLKDLCDPSITPRIPKLIRNRASGCLRHYPNTYHLDRVSEAAPDIFQPRMEPVLRLIKQYEENKKNDT